jgi:hypothetical protein
MSEPDFPKIIGINIDQHCCCPDSVKFSEALEQASDQVEFFYEGENLWMTGLNGGFRDIYHGQFWDVRVNPDWPGYTGKETRVLYRLLNDRLAVF